MACAANLPCEEDVDAPLPLSPADLDNAVRCLLAAVRAPGFSTVRPRPPLTLDVLGFTVDTRLRVTPNLSGPDAVVVLEPVRTPDLDDLAVEAALDLLTLGLAASLLLAAAALDLALAADLALLEAAPLFAREVDLLLDLELVLPLGGIMLLLI